MLQLLVVKMCRIIDGFPKGSDKLIKVFSAASLYYNYSSTHPCFDLENASDAHEMDGWGWQVSFFSKFIGTRVNPQVKLVNYFEV